MATVVITRDITVETIPGIMGVTILDITAATSTGGLTTATGTFTHPDTPITTVVVVIMTAGIAVGVAGRRLVMQRFMQDKNLTLFLSRRLAEQKDMDQERRQVILKLLAEEEARVSRVSQRSSQMDFPHAP